VQRLVPVPRGEPGDARRAPTRVMQSGRLVYSESSLTGPFVKMAYKFGTYSADGMSRCSSDELLVQYGQQIWRPMAQVGCLTAAVFWASRAMTASSVRPVSSKRGWPVTAFCLASRLTSSDGISWRSIVRRRSTARFRKRALIRSKIRTIEH